MSGYQWEQFQRDVQHTGGVLGRGPDKDNLVWQTDEIDISGAMSPVVAGGKIFVFRCGGGFGNFGSYGGKRNMFSALDERDGSLLWSTELPYQHYAYSTDECAYSTDEWASPAYSEGFVYVTFGGCTHKIDARDGEIIKTYDHEGPTCNGGPLVVGGLVICCGWYGKYVCLDATTPGEDYEDDDILWEYDLSKFDSKDYYRTQGTPAYDGKNVYLTAWSYDGDFAQNQRGIVVAVDILSGGLVAYQQLGCVCGSASVAEGLVYVTTYGFHHGVDSYLYALEWVDGRLRIRWYQKIQRSDCTPAIAYGNVYVTGGCSGYCDHQTYCFDALTGELKWQTDPAYDIGGWTRSPTVVDGKVYVGGEDHNPRWNYNRTFCLDAITGEVLWYYPQGGGTSAINNGNLYTAGNNGVLYAFQADPVDFLKGIFPTAKPAVFHGRYGVRQNTD